MGACLIKLIYKFVINVEFIKLWQQSAYRKSSNREKFEEGFSRREIKLLEANPMSGVFQNIDPPPPHRPASVSPPPDFGAGGGRTRWVERGWGVNILEDARHSSVFYICEYFVAFPQTAPGPSRNSNTQKV